MKILLLDPADFFGGAEYFTIDILREFSQHSEISFCLITSGKSEEYVKKIPKNISPIVLDIPRLRPFHPFAPIKTLLKIKKIIKEFSPDIVHSNSVRAGILLSFFAKENWTHFSHDFTTPKLLTKRLQKAKKIFSCSQGVKKDLIQKGVSSKKIKVIPNGIPLPFKKNKVKEADAKNICERSPKKSAHSQSLQNPVISLVGRIDTWKGQDIFIQAAELLKKDLPHAEFRIYGKSSKHDKKTQEFEKKLQDFVDKKNLQNVQFCGQKDRKEIFSTSDIIVHASTKPEPFGRTVLEALAFGVPIIASDAGGIHEILTGNDFSDFRVEPKNPRELAKKILFLTRKRALHKKFKILAAQRVQAFDIKKIVLEIEKEWQKI